MARLIEEIVVEPCLVSVPALLKAFVPPDEVIDSLMLLAMKLPLFWIVPLLKPHVATARPVCRPVVD